ncbi:hypothetical protein GOP47_0012627 [Adiantum capillus-veneris]|uniref:Uncharacterized protein n=1 Tax=Adiantum capillus-veneris TaxID=13818 RepID=A0A9D4ZH04_ADICA|nr:hypothetical protein GOP47_0012627 [Adiantum capillus-veneris]
MVAQRLAFRFFMFLVTKSVLPAMPFLARQWTQLAIQDTSMFPSTMHTLTPWEIDSCPWWIDMEKGHVLGRERELQEMILKDTAMKVPPVDIVEESRAAMRNSQKEKERVVDQIIDEEVEPPPVAPGTIVARRSISFVYIMESPSHCLSSSMDTRCMAIVGDYIAIAVDYRAGIRNLAWVPVHEYFVWACSDSILYTRGTKSVSWAADLIFLDLPFGGSLLGSSTSPRWDICTEDHVRAGVHLAFSTLANSGWLLIMVSLAGEAVGWVERFSRASEMVVHRRIVVLHHGAYGYVESFGGRVECNCSMLFMIHRVGMRPPCFVSESAPLFSHLGEPLRGGLQRSHSFIACFVELLCR